MDISPQELPDYEPRREMTVTERQSFRELYDAHAHGVYTTAVAILKNADTAHDVVHDVFLRAWRQAAQYDPSRGSMSVWLRAVTRNLAIDRLRSAQRLIAHDANRNSAGTPSDESLSHLVTEEQLDALRRAFHRLPPIHRQLVEMAYDQELSHAVIAKRLGQPLGTVKSRIRQALTMLRTFAAHMEPASAPDGTSWLAPVSQAFTTVEADTGAVDGRMRQVPRLQVLVVDDDEETVKLVSAVLKKFGVRPNTHTSARSGLAALEQSWPDVLISDLNMPEEDGYAFIGKARAMATRRAQRLRAAAFTSWASELERSRALIAGFDLYINKPVHPLALMSAVVTLSR